MIQTLQTSVPQQSLLAQLGRQWEIHLIKIIFLNITNLQFKTVSQFLRWVINTHKNKLEKCSDKFKNKPMWMDKLTVTAM